ncbi:hypothetical protein [Kineococcus radiotolerans]|uniref:hypothetical protein n=1 Tax=Kineococcus radiotolerans TaxID=131568 RepID=UPI00003A3B44|nr:hypothetical protein [Kineococcus radiotolerans]
MDAAPEASARIRDDPQRWADDVHTALLRQLTDPARQLPATGGRVHVVRSWAGVHDGHPVLHVVYHHPWWDFTTGLRRHLDEVENYPLNLPAPDVDPAVDLADNIATSDIEEPLGSVLESMAPDEDGVWWWGDPPLPADERRRGPAPGATSRPRPRLR